MTPRPQILGFTAFMVGYVASVWSASFVCRQYRAHGQRFLPDPQVSPLFSHHCHKEFPRECSSDH